MLVVGLLASSAAASGQVSIQDQRGVFLYTEHLTDDMSLLPSALASPDIDGLTALVGWGEIEPRHGVFAWNTSGPNILGTLLDLALLYHKKVDLAIRAGQDTPCWLFARGACPNGFSGAYAGATELTFYVAPVQGVGSQGCNPVPIAAPWDPVFLTEWNAMLSAVSTYLHNFPLSSPGAYYQAVTSVRLTGINRTTAELRLPAEVLPPCIDSQGVRHTDTNALTTWLNELQREAEMPAGSCETPTATSIMSFNQNLRCAWTSVLGMFAAYFPDQYFTLPIIPTGSGSPKTPDYPFPQFDDDNCVYTPAAVPSANTPAGACTNANPIPDQNFPLLDPASALSAPDAAFPDGRLVVAYQNLDLRDLTRPKLRVGHNYVVAYARSAAKKYGGSPLTGFQTNDYNAYNGVSFEQAACSGGTNHPGPCTSATYLQLLETGIFPCEISPQKLCGHMPFRSQYVEVLPPDVIPNLGSYPQDPADMFGFPTAITTAHDLLVDYTPPITFANDAGPGRNGWFTGPVVVTFTATDDLSGVQSTEFSLDGGATWITGISTTVVGQGVHTLSYRSIDNAGNIEVPPVLTVKIDTTPPMTSAIVTGTKRAGGYVGPVTITLDATDNLSGVARTEWSNDSGASWVSGNVIIASGLGTHSFLYRSIDIAGNVEPAQAVTVTIVPVGPPCKGPTCQ